MAERLHQDRELHPMVIQRSVECTVGEEHYLAATARWVIEELEEFHARARGTGTQLAVLVAPHAVLNEDIEVARPLVPQRWWHHHNDWVLLSISPHRRDSHGHGDEGLAHSDLVGQHQPRLLLEPAEDLRGRSCLPLRVVFFDSVRNV